MFGKNRKVICQILVLDQEENLLVLKRSDDLELYPGEYGIAIYGEVQKDEIEQVYVSRIVEDWTGMSVQSYEKVYEDIGLGTMIEKRCYTCIVSGKKKTLQIPFPEIASYEWLAKSKWKDFLKTSKIMKNECSSFHDFFYRKGVAPKHYIDESYFFDLTMEMMKEEVDWIRDERGDYVVCVFAWYDAKLDGVQVYIWDGKLQEEPLHYIISEESVWTKEEEEIFETYARDWYVHDCYGGKKAEDCEWVDASLIYRVYENKYPELSLTYEQDGEPLKLLVTLHHFFQRGPKSILFENELGELALFVDVLEIPYHKDGGTPSEMMFDIPLPVLKAINSYKGAMLLKMEWQRETLKKFYKDVPEFFVKKLNEARFVELKALLLGKAFGFVWGLARHWGNEVWYNQGLRMLNAERESKYAYQDDRYKVVVAKTMEEYQDKCDEMLVDYCKYLDFIVTGQMCFAFVLDRKQNDKTIAAIEVVDHSIIDVYGKCNLEVDEQLLAWVNHYAEEKKLNYRKFENEDDLPLPFD